MLTGADAALETWWSTYDDAQHARADELLDLVGCGGHTAQELVTLSEGERKRVLIARRGASRLTYPTISTYIAVKVLHESAK